VEQERQRVAREIHDALGHDLSVVQLGLRWLAKRLSRVPRPKPQPMIPEKIRSMSAIVDSAIQSVRKIATELRPGVLDTLGLSAAIEWQAQEFEKQTGIICESSLPAEPLGVDENQSTALFRILQECLTNVARHAHATKVGIRLEADARFLCLEVEDNGIGIGESEIGDPQSLGLLGMRERAIALRGEVRFLGVRGKGTTVIARVPLRPGSIRRTKSARPTDCKAQDLPGRNEAQNTEQEGPRA
jgi:signal transduction histidine kinase